MQIKQPVLKTEKLILRPFKMDDAADVRRLAGDRRVADTTLNIPHPYEEGMAEEWIGTHEKDFNLGKSVTFAITDRSDNKLEGAISLCLNKRHNNAEMGYWIGVPFWNKGICSEAARAMIKYGFEELHLNRIFAHHLSRNAASGRVMEKAGMKYEGHCREHVENNGTFEDLIIYGIIRSDLTSE